MPHVASIHVVGRQINGLFSAGPLNKVPPGVATVPGATHASVEIRYGDGSITTLESGPGGTNGRYLDHADYGDRSKPLWDVSVRAPKGSSLDAMADRMLAADRNFRSRNDTIPYSRDIFHAPRNSNAWAVAMVREGGGDVGSLRAEAHRQMGAAHATGIGIANLGGPLTIILAPAPVDYPVEAPGIDADEPHVDFTPRGATR